MLINRRYGPFQYIYSGFGGARFGPGTPSVGFDPASLFAGSEGGGLYDQFDPANGQLFQDSAGTTPVTTAGQPVGRINDRSGNGNHLLQSTNNDFRPTLEQDGGGNWYLDFDGVDDRLTTASSITIAAKSTLILSGSWDAGSNRSFAAARQTGQFVLWASTGGTVRSTFWLGAAPKTIDSGVANSSTPKVHTMFSTGTAQDLRIDGVSEVTDSLTTVSHDDVFALGAGTSAGAFPLDGRVYGAMLLTTRDLTGDEIANAEAYFAARSGVTL